MLSSHREFSTAKSCTKGYIHLYPTQKIITHVYTINSVKSKEKIESYSVIIPTGIWDCRRFFRVAGETIFRISDTSGKNLSVIYLAKTYTSQLGNRETWGFSQEVYCERYIVSISGEDLFS